MAQRHICPSMGAIRRSLTADLALLPKCSSRTFAQSARRLDEQNKPGAAPSGSAQVNPNSRRTRSATVLKQITSLQDQRTQAGTQTGGDAQPSGPRMIKFKGKLPTRPPSRPPPGPMVRGPATRKITPNATFGKVRGPNLGARKGPPKSGARGQSGSGERAPKKRDFKPRSSESREVSSGGSPLTKSLSNGMVHQLLRLQRNEWDRVPYEPKYAPGSLAAQELIHEGRELFRGEAPPVKIWGPLEKRIGVVGMFGAEAHLKVVRELDGEAAPFGQEEGGYTLNEAKKASTTQ